MSHLADRLQARRKSSAQPVALATRLCAIVLEWQRRARSRGELAMLTERELRDLGYSNCDVRAETEKWFWTW